jgi:DNA repair exonuclease SbcCD nuclease subunit
MILLLADIHIGLHKSNEYFYNTVISLSKEIADVCIRKNIKRIAHLGDLFENKRIVSQKSMKVAQNIIENCSDIELIFVRGNHDTYYADKDRAFPNWLTCLREYSNIITVENEPLFLEDYCFVPYGFDINKLDWDKYLFGHFAINSFLMNDNFECKDGIKSESLRKFKHVFSGHFHLPSSKDNITYLGSPFQHNFGDCDSSRGYYILNNDKLAFFEFTSAPKYIKIYTNNFDRDKNKIKGNFIKIIFDEDYGTTKNTQIVEEAERLNPLSIDVDTTKLSQYDIIENKDLVHFDDTKTMFIDFLDKQETPEHINKQLMIKIVDQLWKEE